MAQDPATIRFWNPGGQYPGPSARRFGSDRTEIIGGGHQIAVFPDAESGAAAHFDLLSRGYSNMRLSDALRKWSGGNSADAYLANIAQQTGLAPDTVISPEMLQSPQGLALVRAMAQHEAGRPYPMTDEQWASAQARAFGVNTTPQSPQERPSPPPLSPPIQTAETPPASLPGVSPPTLTANGPAPLGPVPPASLDDLYNQLIERASAASEPDDLPPLSPPRRKPPSIRLTTSGRLGTRA